MKKITAVILAILIIILTIYGFIRTAGNGQDPAPGSMTIRIEGVNKYGTLILDTTFEEMNAGGIEVGDIITACVGDNEYVFPVGTLYTDVDRGEMICRFDLNDREFANFRSSILKTAWKRCIVSARMPEVTTAAAPLLIPKWTMSLAMKNSAMISERAFCLL